MEGTTSAAARLSAAEPEEYSEEDVLEDSMVQRGVCSIPTCGYPDKRQHPVSVFDPPKRDKKKPWLSTWKAKMCCFYKLLTTRISMLYYNPYYWSLLKSITMFSLGVKMFYDISMKFQADCERKRLRNYCEEMQRKEREAQRCRRSLW